MYNYISFVLPFLCFSTSYGKTTMDLGPSDTNPLLSFQTGRNKLTLQAGQSLGLFSFLYARSETKLSCPNN